MKTHLNSNAGKSIYEHRKSEGEKPRILGVTCVTDLVPSIVHEVRFPVQIMGIMQSRVELQQGLLTCGVKTLIVVNIIFNLVM